MPRVEVVEQLGVVERPGRQVLVEIVEVVDPERRRFIRLRTRRREGDRWQAGRSLALREDEAPDVASALAKAIQADPGPGPEGDRRRRLNNVRRKLRAHERAHGRHWPDGNT